MFKALADEGINIQMISTSEIKISVVIDEKYLELAVRVLHKAFELDKAPSSAAPKLPDFPADFDGDSFDRQARAPVQSHGFRRRGRVVEGTPLLREHTGQNLYPGFESLRLRQ